MSNTNFFLDFSNLVLKLFSSYDIIINNYLQSYEKYFKTECEIIAFILDVIATSYS